MQSRRDIEASSRDNKQREVTHENNEKTYAIVVQERPTSSLGHLSKVSVIMHLNQSPHAQVNVKCLINHIILIMQL